MGEALQMAAKALLAHQWWLHALPFSGPEFQMEARNVDFLQRQDDRDHITSRKVGMPSPIDPLKG